MLDMGFLPDIRRSSRFSRRAGRPSCSRPPSPPDPARWPTGSSKTRPRSRSPAECAAELDHAGRLPRRQRSEARAARPLPPAAGSTWRSSSPGPSTGPNSSPGSSSATASLATAIHGNRSQAHRIRAMAAFKADARPGRHRHRRPRHRRRGLHPRHQLRPADRARGLRPPDRPDRPGRRPRATPCPSSATTRRWNLRGVERFLGRRPLDRGGAGVRARSAHPTRSRSCAAGSAAHPQAVRDRCPERVRRDTAERPDRRRSQARWAHRDRSGAPRPAGVPAGAGAATTRRRTTARRPRPGRRSARWLASRQPRRRLRRTTSTRAGHRQRRRARARPQAVQRSGPRTGGDGPSRSDGVAAATASRDPRTTARSCPASVSPARTGVHADPPPVVVRYETVRLTVTPKASAPNSSYSRSVWLPGVSGLITT